MAELFAQVCDVTTYTGFGNTEENGVKCEKQALVAMRALTGDDEKGAGKEFKFCAEHAKLYLSTLIDRPPNTDDTPVMQMGGGTGAVIDEEPYDGVFDIDAIEAQGDLDEAHNRKVAGEHVDDDEPIYDRTKEDNDTEAAAEEELARKSSTQPTR